jgi:hypothetical protein
MRKLWIYRLAFASVLTAAAMLAPERATTAPRFDGNWSVLVITDAGNCDRAYRYSIRVENGGVRYQGEAGINISGHVAGTGKVNVSIGRGNQSANGSGQLSDKQGSGKWQGKSPTDQCSGRWEAERRDS